MPPYSVFVCVCVFVCLCVYVFVCLCVCVFVWLCGCVVVCFAFRHELEVECKLVLQVGLQVGLKMCCICAGNRAASVGASGAGGGLEVGCRWAGCEFQMDFKWGAKGAGVAMKVG